MNVSNSVFYRNLCALSAVRIEVLRTTASSSCFSVQLSAILISIATLASVTFARTRISDSFSLATWDSRSTGNDRPCFNRSRSATQF